MTTKSAAGLMQALKLLAGMPLAGAGIGGLVGAARAEKGKRLRTALGDAGVGAMAGLGFGAGGLAGSAAGASLGNNSHPMVADQNSAALGGLGAGLSAVGAGVLGQKLREEMEEEYDRTNSPLAAMAKIGNDAKRASYLPAATGLAGLGVGGLIGHHLGRQQTPKNTGGLNALSTRQQDNIAKIMVGLGVHNPDDLERMSDWDIVALTSPDVANARFALAPVQKKKPTKDTAVKKANDMPPPDKYNRDDIAALPYVGGAAGLGIGGAAGGLYGLATGKKGKRLQSILRGLGAGALIGGGTGLGAGLMASKAFPKAKMPDFLTSVNVLTTRPEQQDAAAHKAVYGMTEPELHQRVGESALLGGAAGLGLSGIGAAGMLAATADKDDDDRKEKRAARSMTLDALRDSLTELVPWTTPRAGAIGAAAGGIYGGLTGTGAVRGAVRGGLIGTGAGIGAPVGGGLAVGGAEDTGLANLMFGKMKEPKNLADAMVDPIGRAGQHAFTTVPVGATAGGVAGGMAGNKLYNLLERAYDNRNDIAKAYNKPQKKDDKKKEKQAARAFGEKIAEGINWQNVLNTGLGSAAIGAGLGGVYGLINPGEDEDGKPRSRLGSALQNALGGGLLFGAGGAAGEAMQPGMGQNAYNYARDLYQQLAGPKKAPAVTNRAPMTSAALAGRRGQGPMSANGGRSPTPMTDLALGGR